jgi:ubiquinone/menaquinone biosynthesis C-methylase UbiE
VAKPAPEQPAAVERLRDPKRDNAVYHDAAAATYDGKWGLALEGPGFEYVDSRAERMIPRRRYERVLEVGCGTGYWILNLWQGDWVGRAHGTDISPGMLGVCRETAAKLACDIGLQVADAEELPFADGSFDLVTGHAFLHHLPDPRAGLAEMHRVLAPGGLVFLAGEPTRLGDRIAGIPKRAVASASRAAGRVPGLRGLRRPSTPPPATEAERILRDLEWDVDLHTFDPAEVARWLREAGFDQVRAETEELTATLFGWAVRTLESEVRPGLLGRRWAWTAFLGWQALYRMDQALLYRLLPRRLFYNLLVSARKPG